MLGDLTRETLRDLRAHKLRSALTSAGIFWGSLLLTFLWTTMDRVERHYTVQIEKTGPKAVWGFPGLVIRDHRAQRSLRRWWIERDDSARLEELPLVERAAPNLPLGPRFVRQGARGNLLPLFAVGADALAIRGFDVREGRPLAPSDERRRSRVVVLGAEAARRLFSKQAAVDRRISIEGASYRVVGVAEEKGTQAVEVNGRDDLAVLVPYTTAQAWLSAPKEVDQFVFSPPTRPDTDLAQARVRDLLALHHGFRVTEDASLKFVDAQDAVSLLNLILVSLRVFLTAVGIVTLLVGAVGVMNVMLVVVTERTREIGLRKAIGASDGAIARLLIFESTLLCLVSGGIGAGIGLLLYVATGPGGAEPNPATLARAAALSAGLLSGVGVAAGVLPALRALRTSPAEALRAP